MSDKPRLRPYEAEADAVRLSLLPGDGRPEDAAAKAPPPREYSLEDISLLDDGSELPVPLALLAQAVGLLEQRHGLRLRLCLVRPRLSRL